MISCTHKGVNAVRYNDKDNRQTKIDKKKKNTWKEQIKMLSVRCTQQQKPNKFKNITRYTWAFKN